jgi:hypothetical protein
MGEQIVAQESGFRAFHSSQIGRIVKHPLVLCNFGKSKATDMKELNSELVSVCLSVYVLRAALTTPPPFGRTLSYQRFAPRLPGMDSSPETSSGPLPRIVSSRLGSGSRRHTLRASMYRIQRTNLNNGAKDNVIK